MLERLEATTAEPTDENTKLWRFMDFTKYVAMLHRRALFFTRADQLPDPFEGLYLRHAHQRHCTESRGSENDLRQRVCLSCWHENEHESAAMWRLYLSYEDGVALKSSPARLRAALSDTDEPLHLGVVRYLDYDKDNMPARHELDPFFCKRKSFEYEREVRVVWRADAAFDQLGRYLPASLEQLIEEVVISPTAEVWFEDLVRSVTKKYGLDLGIAESKLLEGMQDQRRSV
jgi:hypothetical protein